MKLLYMYMIAMLVLVSGCGLDSYDTIPPKTAGVLLEQPYYFMIPEDGGRIKPEVLQTGKRNLGNGANNLYLIDLSLQEFDWQGNVLMQEVINQRFELTLTYQVVPDRVIDLVLNYISNDLKLPSGTSKIKVNLQRIFNINVQPIFDMVARDVISRNSAMSIETDVVSRQVREQTIEILGSIKIPRITNTEDGSVYTSKDSIAITDVFEIMAVNLTSFENPQVVDDQITLISKKRSELKSYRELLKQAEKKYNIMQTDAEYIRKSNLAIERNLKNTRFRNYYTLRTVTDALKSESGKSNNTKVRIIPEGSTIRLNK